MNQGWILRESTGWYFVIPLSSTTRWRMNSGQSTFDETSRAGNGNRATLSETDSVVENRLHLDLSRLTHSAHLPALSGEVIATANTGEQRARVVSGSARIPQSSPFLRLLRRSGCSEGLAH